MRISVDECGENALVSTCVRMSATFMKCLKRCECGVSAELIWKLLNCVSADACEPKPQKTLLSADECGVNGLLVFLHVFFFFAHNSCTHATTTISCGPCNDHPQMWN